LLDAVSRGADRINRIMCELLDAQQIDLGRFEMVEEQVELNELLQDMTDRAAAMSPKHRIRFAEGRPVAIVADAERLREVMRILLDNAVRYSPGGGDVDVKLRASDGEVVIAVRDQGVGIPVDRRARLFQRFYRAHAGTQHDYGGTGLGLYVARTIVERHGGSIRFESEEGRGTTFTIRLPRRTPDGQA
jgi:signal transduction histidine kinase